MENWQLNFDIARLDGLPEPARRSAVARDRVEGMLLGLAIGDALGNTTEGQTPSQRRSGRGEIIDYLPNRHAGNRSVGLPSDDTQLAYWLLEHLLEHGKVVPDSFAATLADGRRIFGIGHTMRAFLRASRAGVPWWQAAQRSAGNGAVMRVPPVLLPHLREPSSDLWRDAALAGAVTHDDPSSVGACVAMVGILWDLLERGEPPEARWWIDRYVTLAGPIEGDAHLESRFDGCNFIGPVWRLVDTQVREALEANESVLEAGQRWGSGAFLLETMPSVIHVLARHGHDAEQAIVRAVNDTKDNDTVGAIVGAAVGALHGSAALPDRWKTRLLGRTGADDDGRVCELIAEACDRWV